MARLSNSVLWSLWILVVGAAPAMAAEAPVIAAVQLLREGGCGGTLPYSRPVQHNALLDRAADAWSRGHALGAALEESGYRADATAAVRVRAPDSAVLQALERADCRSLTRQGLRDVGFYRRGSELWLVLASAYAIPTEDEAATLALRALQLVNEIRARGTRCGERPFAPAPPVALSGTLGRVALGHASDMAEHDYFEHQDLAGRSPADRVRAVGYHEKLVGENIAYGPQSADEVVEGWLESPGHCENIMDPRFAEMGIAYASGRASRRGLYWVQLLAAPRA